MSLLSRERAAQPTLLQVQEQGACSTRGLMLMASKRGVTAYALHAQEQGVPLEARLYNPYLKVLGRETLAAMELLQEIRTGRYGAASRPNVETFNGIIEARPPPAPIVPAWLGT